VQAPNRTLTVGLTISAAALLAFAWLADEVSRGRTIHFDAIVRNAVHAHASPGSTAAMRAITQLGSPWFLLTLGLFVVWRLVSSGRRRTALLLAVAALGGEAFDGVLKMAFQRTRPEAFFGLVSPHNYSFPSGHALASSCFYGVLAAILSVELAGWRKVAIWVAAAVLVTLIGLSRVYLGVHYPTDVIGGFLAAVVWVALVRGGYYFWSRRAARAVAQL
jgi:undecaprenyl-diphosphatase